jgi:bifunctional DNA-binding transcriptional regulator/antitoxin component of YhaV-PrlF toxin-antitoxin module
MPRAASRLTAKAQTTSPKPVRTALGLKPGDVVVYEISGTRVTLAKGRPADAAWLGALETTLSEWASPEDAKAYDNL